MPRSIAIDGPVGAGKSTLGAELARLLGYVYVDTGALYRTVGHYVLKKYGNTYSEEDVVATLGEINIEQRLAGDTTKIYLNGSDVSAVIRDDAVSAAASRVSGFKRVRDFLFALQRDVAKGNNVVMDGRDIGTVVLPNADCKLFLTASCEVRAKRRTQQLERAGQKVNYNEVLENMKERDYNDTNRLIAPLKMADDAILIDSSEKSFEETLQELYELARED
ncbi:MAG: (d)CMP kinase [Oscillospiraceae bacterium]|nr:(d)CMP kinase [Oscillospiraceae bacterium]